MGATPRHSFPQNTFPSGPNLVLIYWDKSWDHRLHRPSRDRQQQVVTVRLVHGPVVELARVARAAGAGGRVLPGIAGRSGHVPAGTSAAYVFSNSESERIITDFILLSNSNLFLTSRKSFSEKSRRAFALEVASLFSVLVQIQMHFRTRDFA